MRFLIIILNLYKNKKGSILLPIIVSAASLPLLLFMSYYALQFKQRQIETDDFILFKESVHSIIKYTLYGLERKWCFTDKWGQKLSCDNLHHAKSAERLFFGKEELKKLTELLQADPNVRCNFEDRQCIDTGQSDCKKCISIAEGGLGDIHTPSFSQSFPDKEALQTFALAEFFNPYIRDDEVSEIKMQNLEIKVEDISNENPIRGNEKYVRIKVKTKFTEKISPSSKTYTVTWDVSLFPREMNMFSLVLAKDMYFGTVGGGGQQILHKLIAISASLSLVNPLSLKELQKAKNQLTKDLFLIAPFLLTEICIFILKIQTISSHLLILQIEFI